MAVEARTFLDLVKSADDGTFSLPAFQRDWKWQRKQVVGLYDSLRNGFPIGSLLAIETNSSVDLQPRVFNSSSASSADKSSKLILDGQQRLTAGIQLLVGLSKNQGTHYFLDLKKLKNLFQEFCSENSLDLSEALKSKEKLSLFSESLGQDSGYITFKPYSKAPYSKLISNDILFLPLLTKGNETELRIHLKDYYNHKVDMEDFVEALYPLMKIDEGTQVPVITIESGLSIEAISRVFSTLNTTGKMLTPFELVVAILFPQKVNLIQDLKDGRTGKTYYKNMDKTGEIVLQTCVIFDGGDPKKALLPKTLTGEIWEKYKDEAFSTIERIGEFLENELGFPLSVTDKYTPYDSLFCPLAYIWWTNDLDSLDATDRGKAYIKIKKWIVGSILTQRYQEGVHNKQKSDAQDISTWIKSDETSDEPVWLQDASIPSLRSAEPRGAIGKLLMCLLSYRGPRDPIDGTQVDLAKKDCEDHHVFPTKFVPKLTDWDKSNLKANIALNLMRTTSTTNKNFSNDDPELQVTQSISQHTKKKSLDIYNEQFMTENMVDIMFKSKKTAKDFGEFIILRQNEFEEYIKKEFGFEKTSGDVLEEEEAES